MPSISQAAGQTDEQTNRQTKGQADESIDSTLSQTDLQSLKRQLFGGLDISFSGFARIEGTAEQHFDLGSPLLGAGGAGNSFYDFRGWLGSRIAKGPAALHIAVDYAGNDFSNPEGGVFGNAFDATATPGGPSVVRQNGFDLRIRHLYLSYDGFVKASAGRMASRIGHGISVQTIRDSAKLSKRFGAISVIGVLVKGGETQPNSATPGVLAATSDNDLDAYGLVLNYHLPSKQHIIVRQADSASGLIVEDRNMLQLAVVKQVDTTFNERLPEKLLFNINGDFSLGSWSYAFEAAYLAGRTARATALGLGRRQNRAWMGYVKGQYHFNFRQARLALALGAGSGDNQGGEKQRDFQSFFMNAIGFHLANIYGNDIYGYDAFLPGSRAGADGNNAGGGFANTGFVQVSGRIAPFSALPKSTIEAVFTYLRATRSQRIGDGVLFGSLDGFIAPAGVTATSRDIGWEADINIIHPLTHDMHTYLRSGWFAPGAIFGSGRRNAFKLQGGIDFSF
ncbi:hypothetical protein JYT23_01760 [Mariprofundus ferrooxydans]|nr:hypothetical protein [Mariprofundus ferrooxydans]